MKNFLNKKNISHNHLDHSHEKLNIHGQAFIISIILNTLYIVAEFAYGFLANSAALLADAWHNLSDVLALILACLAIILGRKAPNRRFTYGLRSSSILAA